MNFMTIRSAPARKRRNAENACHAEWRVWGIIWSATAAMQWNECCRSAHGGGPGTGRSSELHMEKEKKYEIHISGQLSESRTMEHGKHGFRIWPAVRQWGILWMMPLKKSMQQSMTGSVWSCLRTRRTFRLYPTWMTWTLSRAM